jgi:RNA polymerase-binding transcription factor DksA
MQTLERLLHERELAARTEIRGHAERRADEPYADLAGSVGDPGDEAAADVTVDIDNARIGMQLAALRDIDAARTRIADGTYGRCTGCNVEIDYERLLAYPSAKRCARCQRIHEHTFAGEPHSTL